jgi:methionyl-tRNA synthetase
MVLAMEKFNQREALMHYMDIARFGNSFLQEQQPWLMIKEESNLQAVKDCLFSCLLIVKEIGSLGRVFLPDTSMKILQFLQLQNYGQEITAGNKLGESSLLFEKIEDDQIENQLQKLQKSINASSPKSEHKDMIEYKDFSKLEMRVGTIRSAEKVENADKLLKLTVDIGDQVRTVVSGIAEHFKPEEILEKQVVLLVNLQARTLRGIESQGMILMAEDAQGKLVFINPDEAVNPGAEIS